MHPVLRRSQLVWYATLLLICVTAFWLTALISADIFERIPHVEDEAAYLFQAQVFAQGQLSVATPPYRESYWSPFVIDFEGRRFGKYPPGYPLLLSIGVRAGAPWAINAMLGALTLWVVALLGRKVFSPQAGLLAAALGLTCPVFLAMSSSLLSHATSIFFITLFLWGFAGMLQESSKKSPTGKRHFAVITGLTLGYVIITRPYDAIGVGFPFALYLLFRSIRGDREILRQGLITAITVLFVSLMLPVYWYWLTGNVIQSPYRFVWPYDRPGFGSDVGVKGYTLSIGLVHLKFNLQALASSFLGWPGYLNIFFTLIPILVRPRDTWIRLMLAGIVSLVALHLTYWYYGGQDAGFPRYYYAAIPMLLLLTAQGIETLATGLNALSKRGLGRVGFGRPVLYLALVGLVVYNGLVFLPPNLTAFHGKSGIVAAPLQVVQDAHITNAVVFVTDVGLWTDFAVFFAANNPTLDGDIVYAIYRNDQLAHAVRSLYPDRISCYLQYQSALVPCDF